MWQTYVPLKISVHLWKIVWNRVATADNLFGRGATVAPICRGCIVGVVETRSLVSILSECAKLIGMGV